MSDWEDNVDTPAHTASKPVKKWDDEDVDENDVRERWEDMESSDEEKAKTKKTTAAPAAPQKKKKNLAQKLAEQAAKKEKMNDDEDEDEDDEEEDELDEIERKKRERQAILEADLENTKGMFGLETKVDKISSDKVEGTPQDVPIKGAKSSPLDKINPKTKEEFDEFSKLLVERIRKYEKQNIYASFINEFIRELCSPLKDTDIRKVASTLTTLATEKQKQLKEKEKPPPKKKGKAKPSLQVDNETDITDYNYYDDEFDDFI